jgi:hypothetical protein
MEGSKLDADRGVKPRRRNISRWIGFDGKQLKVLRAKLCFRS